MRTAEVTNTGAPIWSRALKLGFFFGPLLFGLLFIAPATAQILTALDWQAPFGLAPLAFGFILGGGWGVYAMWRGSWISWTL